MWNDIFADEYAGALNCVDGEVRVSSILITWQERGIFFKKGFLLMTTIWNGDALNEYSAGEGMFHLSWKTLSRAQLFWWKDQVLLLLRTMTNVLFSSLWRNKNKWVIYNWITSVEQSLYSLRKLNNMRTVWWTDGLKSSICNEKTKHVYFYTLNNFR